MVNLDLPSVTNRPTYKNASRITYYRDEVTGEKYYMCTICDKRLKGHLSIHMRTHNKAQPWKCEKCGKSFSQKCNLQSHEHIHSKEGRFKCELCNKTFDYKRNLERHIRVHTTEKPYECQYCKKRFTQIDALGVHLRIHTGKKPYQCIFCIKKFPQHSAYASHLRYHIGERSYTCNYCSTEFYTARELRTHTNRMHPLWKCVFCSRRYKKENDFHKHIRQHIQEKSYVCPLRTCGMEFEDDFLLKEHSFVHTGLPGLKCKICPVKFGTIAQLNDHIREKHARRAHTGIRVKKNKTCEICTGPKVFHSQRDLIVHNHRIHHEPLPESFETFPCSVCGKVLFRQFDLTAHLSTHSNDKRYVCYTCGWKYKTNDGLITHRRKFHSDLPRYQFVCKLCDKKFNLEIVLEEHMKIHTGVLTYHCELCSVSFETKARLTMHIKRSTAHNVENI